MAIVWPWVTRTGCSRIHGIKIRDKRLDRTNFTGHHPRYFLPMELTKEGISKRIHMWILFKFDRVFFLLSSPPCRFVRFDPDTVGASVQWGPLTNLCEQLVRWQRFGPDRAGPGFVQTLPHVGWDRILYGTYLHYSGPYLDLTGQGRERKNNNNLNFFQRYWV